MATHASVLNPLSSALRSTQSPFAANLASILAAQQLFVRVDDVRIETSSDEQAMSDRTLGGTGIFAGLEDVCEYREFTGTGGLKVACPSGATVATLRLDPPRLIVRTASKASSALKS